MSTGTTKGWSTRRETTEGTVGDYERTLCTRTIPGGISQRLARKVHDASGQMTIGLCVGLPVMIIVAVIAVNALMFFGDCATFDRECRNAIRVCAASGERGQTESTALARITEQVTSYTGFDDVSGTVARTSMPAYIRFTLTYTYTPTLFGLGLVDEVFGIPLPKPTHSISLTVDPYRAGQLIGL